MISLSIIIPLFDKASFVAQTIAQLVQQLQADDEIIVVDDCSRDEGPAIVQALRHPAVRLLRSQRNDGPASARNLGASQACGTHLLFFDADDLAQPCLLAGLRAAIAGHPSEGVWAYDLAFEAHGESARAEATKTQLPGGDTVVMERDAFVNSCLKGKPLCTASSTCVRADLFKAAGGFVTGLRYCEDPELWARLSAAHRIVRIKQTLATYRDVPTSLSYSLRAEPGSVNPYVQTLLSLARTRGDAYRQLAVSMITRNAVFSIALGGSRRALRTYLRQVDDVLPLQRALLLCLLTLAPRLALRMPLALRNARTRRRARALHAVSA